MNVLKFCPLSMSSGDSFLLLYSLTERSLLLSLTLFKSPSNNSFKIHKSCPPSSNRELAGSKEAVQASHREMQELSCRLNVAESQLEKSIEDRKLVLENRDDIQM